MSSRRHFSVTEGLDPPFIVPLLISLLLYGNQARACSKKSIPNQIYQHIQDGIVEQVVRERVSLPRLWVWV
jgi:hypothetical protein